MRDGAAIGAALLGWYDAKARVLPWRIGPAEGRAGLRPDPYRVWLSEVMLQQTTVAAVQGYFARFTTLWPTVADLAAAPEARVMAEWAGLGYYARARNLLACARLVAARGGFPGTVAELRALPGIGPYTAAAIAAIAFGEAATVVDGNVERVIARLFAVETPLPAARPELWRLAASLTPDQRPGDHAQAMMDLGATICTPRAPACADCPLARFCAARAGGLAAALPRRAPRAAKPVRQGRLWVARRADGALLVEDRPPRGLLGGMAGLPGDGWDGKGADEAPLDLDWVQAGGLRHTFTHFHLDAIVLAASAPPGANPRRGAFRQIAAADLPSLMQKALALAAPHLPPFIMGKIS